MIIYIDYNCFKPYKFIFEKHFFITLELLSKVIILFIKVMGFPIRHSVSHPRQ